MLETYLDRREVDLQVLRNSLHAGLVTDFNRLGHQLVGNARSFGFVDLEPIAAKMESLASENLSQEGVALLHEFTQWLETAKRELAANVRLSELN